ncbi:MAG: phospho-N-acetylmuramoyl-pentapeptide-transferase [Candidatus Kerfeldbacteria bacterium]|nr:phospho-N-acetylmuramoyl-pentapeptide-transferase [Candidatus Kerfeldbacteria bacterium]
MTEGFAVFRVFFFLAIAFVFAMAWTPLLTHILYKYRLGKQTRDEGKTPIFSLLHKKKSGTPTMGGVLVWVTALVLTVGFALVARATENGVLDDLNFLSRSQTLLPLGALVAAAVVGLIDDAFSTRASRDGVGLRARHRLLISLVIALAGAWWFVAKLDWTTIHVPFVGDYDIGLWYVPIFVFILVATSHSVNITDGLDGLSGGVLLAAFSSLAAIAFFQGRYDLATFNGVIIGALLAFVWFNIPPARFFMGDTGSMGLGTALGVIAMLTNTALLLPIIAGVLVLESASVIIQVVAKRLWHRKVFLSAPLHHHFEAKGWPESKVVMRAWLVAGVLGVIGLVVELLQRGVA